MQTPEDLAEIEVQIDRFKNQPIPRPHLPEKLEQRFQRESIGHRQREMLSHLVVALAIYDLFIVGDYLIAPNHLAAAVLVRFGIVTPLTLLWGWSMRKPHNQFVREGSLALLGITGCFVTLYLELGWKVASPVQAEATVLLLFLVINVLLRIDFLYAVGMTLISYVGIFAFLLFDTPFNGTDKLSTAGHIFWTGVLTLFANYTLGKEHRLTWLQRLRGQLHRELLADANEKLRNLSSTDAVTGIANRHAYEERLTILWALALETQHPISAVMVDVDHFKQINDTFGHPYGDRVLKRIASLLQEALRSEGDFVARFGGEEFVVLLPGSDAAVAERVAERIRTLVQVAGSPALTRFDAVDLSGARFATVSCGTATCIPRPGSGAQALIAAADTALYEAKQAGRNCVRQRSVAQEPGLRLKIVQRAS